MAIRILIADDHPVFREGCESIFDKSPNIKCIGSASDGVELIDLYNELSPDIVLIDLSMPRLNGIDAARLILRNNKKARILFCSVTTTKSEIYQVYKAGAKGFISKDRKTPELVSAINKIYYGELYFDEVFTKEDYENYTSIKSEIRLEGKELTTKEKEVLELMAKNYTNKEIAEKLFLSERTVEQRRRRMRAKLGLVGSTELIRFAIEYSNNKVEEI